MTVGTDMKRRIEEFVSELKEEFGDVRLRGVHGGSGFSRRLARLVRLGPVDLGRLRGGSHR